MLSDKKTKSDVLQLIQKNRKSRDTTLYLSDYTGEELPNELWGLTHLKDLVLDNCGLKFIPQEIGYLQNLEYLNLSYNEIASLPYEFSNLIYLEQLRLNHNLFEDFPEVLCSLPNLEILYLDDNRISSLPTSINNFENLTWLALSNNNILSLSKELTYSLKKIDTVEFYNNPFTDMPDIKDKTIVEVFSYLESLNDNNVKVTY